MVIPSPAPTVDWSACEPTEYTPLADPAAVFRGRMLALRSRGSDAQQLAGGMLAAHLARLGGDRNIGRDLDWDDPDEVGT